MFTNICIEYQKWIIIYIVTFKHNLWLIINENNNNKNKNQNIWWILKFNKWNEIILFKYTKNLLLITKISKLTNWMIKSKIDLNFKIIKLKDNKQKVTKSIKK